MSRLFFGLLCALFWVSNSFALSLEGTVVGVMDGDTIQVLDARKTLFKVRLAGIDAPEKKQDFGAKSKSNLVHLIYGKNVLIHFTKSDRYGRIIGKVLLADIDISYLQVSAGLAWHYKKYEAEQSPEDRGKYAEAENKAKILKMGLWSQMQPMPPWDFRKSRKINMP